MRVEDAMHRGDEIPRSGTDALMREVIYDVAEGSVTSVVDGDDGFWRHLRWRLEAPTGKTIVFTRPPPTA
jgi:hypothetical protein